MSSSDKLVPPPVVEYGVRGTKPKNVSDFREQLRDTHKTGIAMGPAGPIVLFGAFLSSTCVFLYRGVRGSVLWVERKIRGNRT